MKIIKEYVVEIIALLIQLFMFYIFPLFAGPTDAMGMVLLILLSTIVLSMVDSSVSCKKIKYVYPIVVSILFIPSVFIHYNESALIHTIWYLVSGYIGCIIGAVIHKLMYRKNKE